MVQVFRAGKNSSKKSRAKKGSSGNLRASKTTQKQYPPGKILELTIDSLDHEAKGVVRGNPVTFVDGGLPGERSKIRITGQQRGIQLAELVETLEPSEHRVTPFCPHYSECGGCQTQHAQHDWLLAQKQSSLNYLIGKLIHKKSEALPWAEPLVANEKGYRRKARLAVDAREKSNIKLGFRDNQNGVFSLNECRVLTPSLQRMIDPLHQLVANLEALKRLGHISLFDGGDSLSDHADKNSLFVVLRFPDLPNETDLKTLSKFTELYECQIVLHLDDDQFIDLKGQPVTLSYPLNVGNAGLKISLNANDFVQVNHEINTRMVQQAMDWLDLKPEDRVLDLFCGVGNFSVPIAQQCQWVTGFEGVPEMVQMAQNNALQNGISNTRFVSGDLTQEDTLLKLAADKCNKVLLDPARSGALEAVEMLVKLKPETIVYVSCNPATFGRDIAKLIQPEQTTGKSVTSRSIYKKSGKRQNPNYELKKLSLIDMFPGTAHSELMGLFKRA